MKSIATKIQDYLSECPDRQRQYFRKLRDTIVTNLPNGFQECINYGMLGYVVPHTIYPLGYHCDPRLPLPFLGLAYQKNSINLYHMGIYADTKLLHRFQSQWQANTTHKLDMGKSCIRLKYYQDIPYNLLGKLVKKMSVQERIDLYQSKFKDIKNTK